MDLNLNEMQEMIKRTGREFFDKECPNIVVRQAEEDPRGYPPELWQKMAQQGWAGMILPSQYGGADASFLDLCVLYEEMGRAMAPGPFLDVALSEYLLLDLGSDAQKRQYLPQLGSGNLLMTVAYTEPSASYDPDAIHLTATRDGNEFILNGAKLFVTNAHVADQLLVVARTREAINKEDGLTVFLVDPRSPGLTSTLLSTIASDRQSELVFDNVRVPAGNAVGPVDGAWPGVRRYLDRAKVLTCVASVGGAEKVLEMTVDYAKSRVQFGRPIGTFQAISHKCSDMAIDLDGMRFVVYHAAWRVSEDLAADQEIAVAKAWTSDAYRRITALGHQVHGGVGFMMEFDMQMYFRRAKAAEVAFGDGDYHRELVAQGLGL
ncbi:MAG: acyl-CoA/acyl-ACP dehydrogenase [Chloroflexi bacterium]|nr:acyl-CoA/acyl-ACP dehydrogenase [Chloroflexota bacterium]